MTDVYAIQQWDPRGRRWEYYAPIEGPPYQFHDKAVAEAVLSGLKGSWDGTPFPVRLCVVKPEPRPGPDADQGD